MEKKVCTKCKEEKELTEFNSGRNECKLCRKKYIKEYHNNNKEYFKEYYENNKDKKNEMVKIYRENNKEKIKDKLKIYRENNKESINLYQKIYREKNKEKQKEYRESNKERLKEYKTEYERLRKQSDLIYKLSCNIRNLIRISLKNKGYSKKSKTYEIIGVTFEEFKTHIESQWEGWMNWDNYGRYNSEENYGWDLDHIIPLSYGKCEEDIIRLNHHSNIQPLCSYINRNVKRDKII